MIYTLLCNSDTCAWAIISVAAVTAAVIFKVVCLDTLTIT
jgi:hypothetical protein